MCILFATLITNSLFAAIPNSDVYHVLHLRPSAILDKLQFSPTPVPGNTLTNFLPSDLHLKANDEESTISLDGPQDKVALMKSLLSEFDVTPRTIEARITISSRIDKYHATTVAQMSDGSPWTLIDGRTNLTMRVTPRLNDDGTVTASLDLGVNKLGPTSVCRSKLKATVLLGLTGDNRTVFESHTPKGERQNIEVSLILSESPR